MKREADKIAEKLGESEKALKLLELRVSKAPSGAPLKWHPPSRNKHIEGEIAEINKKIRRAKNRRNKECLIAKREALKLEINWGPKQLEGAFCGAYSRYRIDGIGGMDVVTFFARTRRFLMDLLTRETRNRNRAVRSQAAIWIRFVKDGIESVNLAFNSRMLAVYNLSDMGEIASEMIKHMQQQIENPALKDSKFVFDEVIHMNIDFHRLNLTRGSSYLPLPEWLTKKGAIINPKNSDMECFKWAVIAASRWEDIGNNPKRISKLIRYEGDFDWSGVKFLASFRDIKRFESRNEITINILAFERKKVYICRRGKEYDRVANLMLITDRNNKHYVDIKYLTRLLSRQNSKHKESNTLALIAFRDLQKRNLEMNT